MAAIQVNARFPDVLLKRIDSAAGEGNRSQWILEACRMRLDGTCEHGISLSLGAACKTCHPWLFTDGDTSVAEEAGGTSVAGSIPAPQSAKPDMQGLREICAGKLPKETGEKMNAIVEAALVGFSPEHELHIPRCLECDFLLREVKGKWACTDESCAMYGREQRPKT